MSKQGGCRIETVNNRKLRDAYIEKLGINDYFSSCQPVLFLLHYSPGELLTSSFSPSRYFQFVAEGELLLYDMPDESSTIAFDTNYYDVQMLGEMELINADFMPFFVEAKTDVYTIALHMESYRQQLLNDPVFLRRLCLSLANKLHGATQGHDSVPLKTRVERSLMRAEPGQTITGISHIARSLNMSNRQMIRVLQDFCEQGILAHEKKGIYRVLKKPGE